MLTPLRSVISPSAFPIVPSRASFYCSVQPPQNAAFHTDRVTLQLQYNGSSYHGWEAKPHLRTVESVLLDSLSSITKTETRLTAASRTDAGAHAIGQVVHFDITERYLANAHAWTRALNNRLPPDVRVTRSSYTSPEFDARRSAIGRYYRYTIRTTPSPNVFLAPLSWHYYQRKLDVSAMNKAAQSLISDKPRDLSAFRKVRSSASHTNIQIRNIAVRRRGDLVQLDVTANWFVYGMMRLLAATLLQVGTGALSIQNFDTVVKEGRREEVKFSAPACGLCLMSVEYPPGVCPFESTGQGEDGASELEAAVASF